MAKQEPRDAAVQRQEDWAVRGEGRTLFRWDEAGDGALLRCRVFYRGKVPAHQLEAWCRRLFAAATGRQPGEPANAPA